MRRLTPSDYRRMPWRNGGGTTTEIAIAPEGAALGGERFLYRVSIADVATSGPFSRFDGYDRHIMLLDGAGMTLDCGPHGRIDLATPLEPRAFSGDWDVEGTLVGGAVRDFNLIVDRARASSALEVRVLEGPETIACAAGSTCIIHVIDGALDVAGTGDTLVAGAPFDLVPLGAARVAIARIVQPMTRIAARDYSVESEAGVSIYGVGSEGARQLSHARVPEAELDATVAALRRQGLRIGGTYGQGLVWVADQEGVTLWSRESVLLTGDDATLRLASGEIPTRDVTAVVAFIGEDGVRRGVRFERKDGSDAIVGDEHVLVSDARWVRLLARDLAAWLRVPSRDEIC